MNVVVQSLSHVRLFAIPWTAACQASLSLTISQSLPKFTFIASVMPSSHLVLSRPLLLLYSVFPNIRDFSNESAVCIRGPKYWSISFSISPCKSIQGWFSLRLTGLIYLLSKGLSGVFSSTTVLKASILRLSAFFTIQLSQPYVTTGKTIDLTISIFVTRFRSLNLAY